MRTFYPFSEALGFQSMWGHAFGCACPVCKGLLRVFNLIGQGSQYPGFVDFTGSRVRGLEGELRDELSRLGPTEGPCGVGAAATAPAPFSNYPFPFPPYYQPKGAESSQIYQQVVPGPPPPGPPPLKGAGSSQCGAQVKQGDKTLDLYPKSAGPRSTTSLPKESPPESQLKTVKEEPKESPAKANSGVVEPSPTKVPEREELPRRKRSRSKKEKKHKDKKEKRRRHRSPEDKDSEKGQKERKQEESSERGVKDTPNESAEPSAPGGSRPSRSLAPREPSHSPPRRGSDKERKHKEDYFHQGGTKSGAKKGPGWFGPIPYSTHHRWRGKNKGVVKRAKQERFNERYR